jgi:tetratricopeptide (TPR) repeat protein
LLLVSFSGCANKQKKIDQLKIDADKVISQGNYDEAISIYNKILDIDDKNEYRNQLAELQNAKNILELKEQADLYRKNGELDNAIDLYVKMLQIDEDEAIRKVLDDIKYEKESVEKTIEFIDLLKEINTKIPNGRTVYPDDMRAIFMELKKSIDDFKLIDDTRNTDIAKYINNIRQLDEYKRTVGTTDAATGSYYDAVLMAMGRSNLINYLPVILAVEFPQKY